MMAYDATVKRYLKALQNEYDSALRGGQHTAELSYRVPMHELFKSLSHDLNPNGQLEIILEPKKQGRVGRPDWRIHNTVSLGVYGYIEGKGLSSEDFDITPYQKQIEKYLTLKHKLIISDGIDFVFCFSGATPVVISIIEKQKMSLNDWSTATIDPRFKFYMEQFFSNPAPQQVDEDKLVELVAIRTRCLADDIISYADLSIEEAANESERQIVNLLSGIRNLVYSHNDSSLHTGAVFADFTAQVIMFCLLYAHRVFCSALDTPVEKVKKINDYAFCDITEGESMLPFRNLMIYLRDNADRNSFICQWVDECVQFLSFLQMTDEQLSNPDYHRLFELFLSKYDPKSRFDYGAFYTPKILANYVVKMTNAIVANDFLGASIYDEGNTIIDPCCGTGSFLEQVVLHDESNGAYNLCGFEILPAPYMLANYRLAVVEKQHGVKKLGKSIILANTLNNCVLGGISPSSSIEANELSRAQELSSLPIKLIIGNPPCSDSMRTNSNNDFSIINTLTNDFRPPESERRGRQNTQKQVNGPFMQFLRWSCEKLLNTENHSVLALVVPLSFLEAESYKYARKYLTEHFSNIWAVAIDADARTGVRSDSLFNTLQGRAVIVVTRKYGEHTGISEFSFADYSHCKMAQKLTLLSDTPEGIISAFTKHPVNQHTSAFFPTRPFNEEMYQKFWPISDDNGQSSVFMSQCSGAKMAPTSLFTHVKASMLKRRSREIAVNGLSAANDWIGRQDKPASQERILAFQNVMNTLPNRSAMDRTLSESISTISFRPFVNSNAVLWNDLIEHMSSIGGKGTRIRPEIQKLYEAEGTIGFSLAHAPKDLAESLGQFASFCWYFPDNDLTRRGNGHIYANQYVDSRNGSVLNNISRPLLDTLTLLTGLQEQECAQKVVFYSYAILCSQVYMDEFYGALFTVNQSDRRCRIPMVGDKETFFALSNLGEKLALLEKADTVPDNILSLDYDNIIAQLPIDFRLESRRSPTKSPYDAINEELIIRGESTGREIHIPCPIAIQNFTVSGYNVVKDCWLKFHSYRFTNCEFTTADMRELLNLLNAIYMQMRYVLEIDDIMHDIINGDIELINP